MEYTRHLTALEAYYYLHNPILAIKWIWGFDLPWTSVERLYFYWYAKFATDCSGRSTAKSHDAITVFNAKCILIPGQKSLLLGQDKSIGTEFFDEYVTPWINRCPLYKQFIVPYRGKGDKRPAHKDGSVHLRFMNDSIFETFSPDWRRGAKKVQSHRVNRLIFNEWTSYHKMEAMEMEVEPIVSRTNYFHRNTRKFQEAMEKWIGEAMGLANNAELGYIHKGEPYYTARPYLDGKHLKSFKAVRDKFYKNFQLCYQFDYEQGVDKDVFKPIRNKQDIRDFFKLFLEGDPVYQNQIIYDGSAKRPEDDSFQWIEYVAKKLGEEAQILALMEKPATFGDWLDSDKIKDHSYSYYSVHVDDIPRDYDGVVFDSRIINKFRQNNLNEDFQRVYGGKWVSGFSRRPYDAALIAALRVRKDDSRYFKIQTHGNPKKIYISGSDAAKGQESLRKGMMVVKTLGRGGGDDGGMAIFEFGDGTSENPDKLVNVYKAEDVRPEPMAFDMQCLYERFPSLMMMGLDPNGGGGAVADMLKKPRLEKDGQSRDFVPIVPMDYNPEEAIAAQRILVFISRGTEILRGIRVMSPDEKTLWKGDDVFVNHIHTKAQIAIYKQTVLFPPEMSDDDIIQGIKEKRISAEQAEIIQNVELAVQQLTEIEIEMDKQTKKPVLTSNGCYRYTALHKKDLAYCIVYGLYLISVWREYQEKINEQQDGVVIVV